MATPTITLQETDFVDPLSDFEPEEFSSELQRSLAEDEVLQLKAQPCAQIASTATVKQAVELMRDLSVSCLLVVKDQRLVGIFTERDVLERVCERYERVCDAPVTEAMTENPTVVYESDPPAAAVAAIAVAGHRHVPVLALDGEVRGVLSPRRVFAYIEKHW